MKLTESINARVIVGDIETLKKLVDFGFYEPDTKKWYEFQISEHVNQLYEFASFFRKTNWDYVVGYNWIGFDAQVIQYVLNNYQNWSDCTNMEIVEKIYTFVQNLIDGQKYGAFKPYREDQFEITPLDVFTMLGLDNEARRSSLKKVQYQLDFPNVEEMPIPHNVEILNSDDIKMITSYRRNDVLSTLTVFELCMGITEHPLYKGKNQLEQRFNIKQEFGLECLSYSDIKIGDELLKQSYAKAIGKEVWELPKKGFFRKSIKLSKAIPSYVEFKTPELQKILKDTKSKEIGQFDKHEVEFTFKGTKYTIGLGGGHSDNTSEIWEADENYRLLDLDVGSLYPAIIVNNKYFPFHLGKELLKVYEELYHKRIELKPLSKKDKKIAGIVDAIKLILNSAYGKMGSVDSWMFDKQVQVNVCLTGQFALLMLIEAFELEGIHVFSFNTDGITVKLPKGKEEVYDKICKDWMTKTNFVLEEVEYLKLIYSTVNDYLAIKKGYHEAEDKKDYVKFKGDFISDFELWKNKSWRVVALSLQEYFIKGTNPVDFIKNHDNIFDFCIMARASGDLYLELQGTDDYVVTQEMLLDGGFKKNEKGWYTDEMYKAACITGEGYYPDYKLEISFISACKEYVRTNPLRKKKLKKLVRYYLTTDTEWQMFKRGTGSTGKDANISLHANNELGNIYVKYFNKYEKKPVSEYNIDYNQYIYKAFKLIDKIEKSGKLKRFVQSANNIQQLSLF